MRYMNKYLISSDYKAYDFFKIGILEDKKNYKIIVDGKVLLKSPILSMPFGVEKYYGKDIVNLSFNTKDNASNNFLATLRSIDSFFQKLQMEEDFAKNLQNKLPEGFLEKIKGKGYKSCIKQVGTFPPLLRCHLKRRGDNIISKFYESDKKTTCNPYQIAKRSGNMTIELGFLWVTNDIFGLTFYLNGGLLM